MAEKNLCALVYLVFVITVKGVRSIGVNWGTASSHALPPDKVVALLKANNIKNVKLFDADPLVLRALSGSGIEVMVGIPNEMLKSLNSSKKAAENWVHENITRYNRNNGGVQIKYIAVGDDPFLLNYGDRYKPFVFGAMANLHLALTSAKLDDMIKLVVPCNADILQAESNLPSKGIFRSDLNKTMTHLLSFFKKQNSPFVINISPYLNFLQNKNFSIDFVQFKPTIRGLKDGRRTYTNSFDVSLDTLISALSKSGFDDIDITVGQIGWPTDGAPSASPFNAKTFMKGLVDRIDSKAGTPLRPRKPPVQTYIFSLLDEDQRSIEPGGYERHWGVFTFDGQAKYYMDLGQGSKDLTNAENVAYLPSRWCVVNYSKDLSNATAIAKQTCSVTDCSVLSPGASCSNITWPGNVSYAFNSYYQQHNQEVGSCDFDGLGLLTTVNPSDDDCNFPIGLRTSSSSLHEMLISYGIGPLISLCINAFALQLTVSG